MIFQRMIQIGAPFADDVFFLFPDDVLLTSLAKKKKTGCLILSTRNARDGEVTGSGGGGLPRQNADPQKDRRTPVGQRAPKPSLARRGFVEIRRLE